MHTEQWGRESAPTIVFIHGGGVAGWMWQKQWEAFSDYHCLIPDLPDHGQSANEGPINIEDCAKRIAGLIRNRANGGKAHIVGHSLGAKVLVELLATEPEVIDRAVVASALFRPIPMMNWMLNMPSYRLTAWLLRSHTIMEMQAKQFDFPNDFYREHFKKEISKQTPEMLDRIYSQLNKHLVLPDGLEKANVPTLVIAGDKEPKAMRSSVSDIARALPHAKAYLIEGAKHNYPWAEYETVNAAIREWIEGNSISTKKLRAV